MIRPVRTVAPATQPVTLAEAKEFARVDSSDHDSMLQSLIDSATNWLDGRTGLLGRCIINQTWRQDYTGWQTALRLPFPDVSSVTVKYFDVANVEQTVSSALYQLLEDELGAIVRFGESFTNPSLYDDRQDRVRITLIAGYGADASAVPDALKTAIKMLVTHWYDSHLAGAQTFETPFGVSAIIAPFRRRGF